MSTMAADSLPMDDEEANEAEVNPASSTITSGGREIQWKVVAKTPGITPATIIADRLMAEGVPARAWQEGAGQAIGLTVGLLGTGYVVVPEDRVDEAEQILSEPLEFDDDESLAE